MKTSIVVLVLVVAISAFAQSAPPQQPPAAGATAAPAPPQQKKEIKDPAEYNAYINAIQQSSPQGKTVALEGFVQQYPNSVVKEDALEALMGTYYQTQNVPKAVETANRLLQASPNNVNALALLTLTKRGAIEGGQAAPTPQNTGELRQMGLRGLQALQTYAKPEGVSDADYHKRKTDFGILFNSAAGFAALQQKDYATAQQYLQASVNINPANLNDVYPLGLAYLEAPQPNYLQGLWYIGRAINLAANNPAAQQQIAKYGRSKYVKYHGNDQGWDQVVQQAAASPTPPANFAIAPRPTPAQEAAQLVQTKPVKEMTFDEFQLIFTSGNQQAASTVWDQIKDKPIAFAAKVKEVTPTKLTLSATADDIEKNVADVDVTMVAAIPAKLMPKPGAMTQIEATPVSYTAQPFSITMTKGTLIGAKAEPAPPARKPPVRRRPG